MSSSHSRPAAWRRIGAAGIIALAAAATLGGCKSFGPDTTGAVASVELTPPTDPAALRAYADRWGRLYDANPGDKYASINYARALRDLSRCDEALAVMRVAAVKAPNDYEVLGAYGKALADDGQLAQAKDVFTRAYSMDRPDWTIMSAQGTVEDRLGDHVEAQRFYTEALKIAPGEPSVLANLGLSYALTKRLDLAEKALSEAAASPAATAKVRQNFALVLALEGKFAEAEAVSRRDMSEADAKRNVDAIRNMIAQNDSWKSLETKSADKRRPPPAPAG
ncbi:MAG: tetratricopeptide repeat protein [Roseiarcus sp.]